MNNVKKQLKILFIGDISARPGRHIVKDVLHEIRKKHNIDLVIANAENSAGGRGVTREVMTELLSYGIDFFTSGEHIWKYREFSKDLQDKSLPIIRPYNYEGQKEIPGKGWDTIDLGSKGRVVVANFLGTVFMNAGARNPFWAFDDFYEELKEQELDKLPLIIDLHAEATAEKISFAWYVKDKVSAVLGTHTHVPTADPTLLPTDKKGHFCAFITDTGMCGVQFASLWVQFEQIIHNSKYPFKQAFKPEMSGPRIFNSVLVELEGQNATKITRIDRLTN